MGTKANGQKINRRGIETNKETYQWERYISQLEQLVLDTERREHSSEPVELLVTKLQDTRRFEILDEDFISTPEFHNFCAFEKSRKFKSN